MTGPGAPILIVDDRPTDLEALEIALADLRQPIVRASSGQEALEVLLRRDFAVILLDVRMPGMDGFETAKYVRLGKRSRHTPIIFVTAGDDDLAGALRGYSAGAVDYIPKPVQPDVLRSKVRVFVELYEKGRQLELKAEELASANSDLRAACRDLEVFTYTVAHELRAPLRTMSGFGQILLEEYAQRPLDATGLDFIRKIDGGARRMDALIRDLLAYCQVARSPAVCETLDPGPVVDDVKGAFAAALRERSAEMSSSPAFPPVVGNRSLLRLAISNFVSNAITFVAPDIPPKVRIGHDLHEGRVRIWVEDNGPGIEAAHHERIFGAFERLDPTPQAIGTGIGLAIAKAAAERMGGRVGVRSDLGKGSRFWIELAGAAAKTVSRRIDRR